MQAGEASTKVAPPSVPGSQEDGAGANGVGPQPSSTVDDLPQQSWQGQAPRFMRSNEHSRERQGAWDASNLQGVAREIVEGDRDAGRLIHKPFRAFAILWRLTRLGYPIQLPCAAFYYWRSIEDSLNMLGVVLHSCKSTKAHLIYILVALGHKHVLHFSTLVGISLLGL